MAVVSGAVALGGAALGALGAGAAGLSAAAASTIAGLGTAGVAALAGAAPGVLEAAGTFLESPIGKGLADYVGADKAAQLAREQAEGKNIESELNRVWQSAEAELGRDFTEKLKQEQLTFQSTEAEKGRGFTAEEAQLRRGFTAEQAALQRTQQAQLQRRGQEFATEEAQRGRQFALGGEERARQERVGLRARGEEIARTGEERFLKETERETPELTALRRGLREEATEDIARARGETRAALAAKGVRGAQAGTILGRTIGQLRKEKERDISRLGLEEARRRREARTGFFAQKGRAGIGRALA